MIAVITADMSEEILRRECLRLRSTSLEAYSGIERWPRNKLSIGKFA
jgi:hypothetical protein